MSSSFALPSDIMVLSLTAVDFPIVLDVTVPDKQHMMVQYSTVLFNSIRYNVELNHGPLAIYVQLRVKHVTGIPGTFTPPQRVNDPDMHHGTCVTHVS